MTAQFTVSPIRGGGFVVEGTDAMGKEGTTILRSDSWAVVLEYRRLEEAQEVFDNEVDGVFGPILAAAEKLHQAQVSPSDATVVVLKPAVEGVKPEAAVEVTLDAAGEVLQAIELGEVDSLRWINGDLYVMGS